MDVMERAGRGWVAERRWLLPAAYAGGGFGLLACVEWGRMVGRVPVPPV